MSPVVGLILGAVTFVSGFALGTSGAEQVDDAYRTCLEPRSTSPDRVPVAGDAEPRTRWGDLPYDQENAA